MSTDTNNFRHLSLSFKVKGRARLTGGGEPHSRTLENKSNREGHVNQLQSSFRNFSNQWQQKFQQRRQQNLPDIPEGAQLLLEIDPNSDRLDFLCSAFDLEIVSEQEDGFVIVATSGFELSKFYEALNKFVQDEQGGASVAKLYQLKEDEDSRLQRILSDYLYQIWPTIQDNQIYVIDIGIECLGTSLLTKPRDKRDTEAEEDYKVYIQGWTDRNRPRYEGWDNLKLQRENDLQRIVDFYQGEIFDMVDGDNSPFLELPDSFTARISITGQGLRDLALNYIYIFEITEPDSVRETVSPEGTPVPEQDNIQLIEPEEDFAKVCVIDSGIQEGHRFIAPAIHQEASYCYLPNTSPTDVADYVQEGGHGTRVAGAVLYPRQIPRDGIYQLPCWIQNARVLNANNELPDTLFPAQLLRNIIYRYYNSYGTKIFNHSIASFLPCRVKHMSAWAAEIDNLSYENDILIIQAAGNIPIESSIRHRLGIVNHFQQGRNYPDYLLESSCRIANPAQSMNALTVGSISENGLQDISLQSLGDRNSPSAFSATGPGIWDVIKPDVVEYGGTYARDTSNPPRIIKHPELSPELLRANTPPAYARDDVGTSYATPKVAHIAATLAKILPSEPALLYRALIVQSASWPEWAKHSDIETQHQLLRYIGYGIPDIEKATTNNPYRITFITSGVQEIKAKEAQIFEVSLPQSLRDVGEEHDILIEITLSYAAKPRRTRRNKRGYLSVWLDWAASYLGEEPESFANRILYNGDAIRRDSDSTFPWRIGNRSNWGQLNRGSISRSSGTLQKDWVIVQSHQLTSGFCIGICGHTGWDKNPESIAKYTLAVSFEAVNRDIQIYDQIQILNEVEVEEEVEIEI